MASATDPTSLSPGLLRRLARENQTMGPRLAQLEFEQMMVELDKPDLFELDIDFPDPGPVAARPLPDLANDPIASRLPVLNVNLGKVAWIRDPQSLPVVGIYVPRDSQDALRPALAALMRNHHAAPFARFVFLCQALRPIPFLGRYDFTYEYLGSYNPMQIADRMHIRYGLKQIRDLLSGQALWRRSKT